MADARVPAPALYYLVGPPAVGKLTVARELVALVPDAVLLDNHLWNDPIFVAGGLKLGTPRADLDDLREQVRQLTLQAMTLAPAHASHVITHVLLEGDDEFVDEMRSVAEQRRVRFVPVWLTADRADLRARVANEDRFAKVKLTDAGVLDEILDQTPLLAAPADAILVDTGRLSPAEAARRIVEAL